MSKKSKIRWREADEKELQRLVKNYNAKLTRISKSAPETMQYMPERMTMKQARAMIETRADLKRVQKNLNAFTKRGAETVVSSSRGAKATQWEVDIFKANQRAENIRRAKRKKALGEKEVTVGGKPTGSKRKEMGSIKENAVKPSAKKFDSMSQREWNKASTLMEQLMRASYSEAQKKIKQENYIKAMIREGYSDELIDYITTIPTDKFLEIMDTDETATIDFVYDKIDLQLKEITLWDVWEVHGQGKNVTGIDVEQLRYDLYKKHLTI